jgi:hypothetical protein
MTLSKLQEIKSNFCKYDENYCLDSKDVDWLIEQTEWLQYTNDKLQKENDLLCDKLADIRNLFDESDIKAEGHGMEDAIASPYAVACYAENKLTRLIKENKELQEELDKWIAEFMI